MKNMLIAISLCLLFISGCATTPPLPLSYLSLEKPKHVISTKDYNPITYSFNRGGFYVGNYNFRPLPVQFENTNFCRTLVLLTKKIHPGEKRYILNIDQL